jgi:hypothetical protein
MKRPVGRPRKHPIPELEKPKPNMLKTVICSFCGKEKSEKDTVYVVAHDVYLCTKKCFKAWQIAEG